MLVNLGYTHMYKIWDNYSFSAKTVVTLKPLNVTFIHKLPAFFFFRKKPSLVCINEPDATNLQSNILRILRFFWILSSHISLCLPIGTLRLNFVITIVVPYLIGIFGYALLVLICHSSNVKVYFDCHDTSALSDITVTGSKSDCLFTVQKDAVYYKAVFITIWGKYAFRNVLFVTICTLFNDIGETQA
jgi:hypothetical protein